MPVPGAPETTAQGLLEKLDRVYDGATDAKQYSAAERAISTQARIAGVGAADRIEIGAPGEFGGPPTVAETLEMVAREFGPVTASALAWTLDYGDREMPVDDVARFTLAAMTLDEALVRHEQLRAALLKAASDGAVLVEADWFTRSVGSMCKLEFELVGIGSTVPGDLRLCTEAAMAAKRRQTAGCRSGPHDRRRHH